MDHEENGIAWMIAGGRRRDRAAEQPSATGPARVAWLVGGPIRVPVRATPPSACCPADTLERSLA